MKYTISLSLFLSSLTSMASVCSSDDQKLLQQRDQVVSQYECDNQTTTLCITKAIRVGDKTEYTVVSGEADQGLGQLKIDALVPSLGNNEGHIVESDDKFELMSSHSQVIMNDHFKFRQKLSLDKTKNEVSYLKEFKKSFSFSGWKTLVSENLSCRKLK